MLKIKFFIIGILCVISSLISAQNGTIEGLILDKETNEPIIFANILIEGQDIGGVSNEDGTFKITGVPPGFQKLVVSYLGFKTITSDDVFVGNNLSPYIEIKMEQSETVLDQVIVKADPFQKKEDAIISVQTIGTKEIENNPGSNRDISRVIQSFPGVGSTPAFRK